MATNNARREEDAQPAADEIDQVIGANVHALMWARHESQTTVAKDWGISPGYLSLKIRGKRRWSAEDIRVAAARYAVDPGILFSRNSRMPDYEFASSYDGNVVSLFDWQRHPRSRDYH